MHSDASVTGEQDTTDRFRLSVRVFPRTLHGSYKGHYFVTRSFKKVHTEDWNLTIPCKWHVNIIGLVLLGEIFIEYSSCFLQFSHFNTKKLLG